MHGQLYNQNIQFHDNHRVLIRNSNAYPSKTLKFTHLKLLSYATVTKESRARSEFTT